MTKSAGVANPLYKQVYDAIMERIITGDLTPGAMLPSEMDLATHYNVSQGTARKALIELEKTKVVHRQQGRGTFVSTTTPEASLYHFFRLRQSDGSQVIPAPLSEAISKRMATQEEADALKLELSPVFEIRRVRQVDKTPVSVEKLVLPAHLFPGLNDRGPLPNSLYSMYQSTYGLTVARADEKLQAVSAPSSVAELLGIDACIPVMMARRCAIGIADNVIEFRTSYYRTDGLHYEISLR